MRPTALAVGLLALVIAGVAFAAGSVRGATGVDTGLCPFPLDVTVTNRGGTDQVATTALRFEFNGPSTIKLRNGSTGRTVTLDSSGPQSVDTTTGSIVFGGRQVWYWSTGNRVPFLATDGAGSLRAPSFQLAPGPSRAHVIDPCAEVAKSPPSTKPATTRAPWGLPAYALSQMAYAGLTPLLGRLVRHDHVHLDVIVHGRSVTIPAGVGLAEPVDGGACPESPVPQGDCVTRHIFAAAVANSPLHTHSKSGLIHIEPDRPGRYTLGQFFDEWGVRLDSTCLGGYCTGGGGELRAYVNGKRVRGNPRGIVLTNRQEIAVVFGRNGEFGSVPARYTKGWPGLGCGGTGEPKC